MLDQFGYFFSPVQKSWLMNTYRFYPFVSDYFESAAMFAQSRWWSGYIKKRVSLKIVCLHEIASSNGQTNF